jgi:hypothetical protein
MFAMSLSQTKLTKQALRSSISRGVIGNAPVTRELQGTIHLAQACAADTILALVE